MTTTSARADAVIAAARSLAPAVHAEREVIDHTGRLPQQLLEQIADAGLFRLYMPAALGGLEVDPITFTRAVEEVAQVDGSAGWLVAVAATYSALPAYLSEDVARQLTDDPTATIAGTINPSGRAVVVPGGYRVSGRWAFGSGILHSRWVIGNCVVIDGDGPRLTPSGAPELRIVIAPVSACHVLDTWHTAGLRGTGSHDYTFDDVLYPTTGRSLRSPRRPTSLARCTPGHSSRCSLRLLLRLRSGLRVARLIRWLTWPALRRPPGRRTCCGTGRWSRRTSPAQRLCSAPVAPSCSKRWVKRGRP